MPFFAFKITGIIKKFVTISILKNHEKSLNLNEIIHISGNYESPSIKEDQILIFKYSCQKQS